MHIRNVETSRMILRDFIPEDAKDLFEILGDEETMRSCEPAYNFEKTKAFLQNFCINRRGAVAAVEKHAQKVIGYLLFSEVEPGIFEIGWFFNRSYWRQGYAYEACKALMAFAFQEGGAHKVFAETIDKEKSVGLMKKLGMTLEEVQRNQVKGPDGERADLYIYALPGQ